MLRVWPAGSIAKGRVGHAERVRRLRHLRGKILLASRQPLGDRDGRVVAGLDDDAVDQVLDTDTLADLDEHLRSALAPRLLAYRKRVVERETRSEEHTSELQSLMRISYAVFCLKKKTTKTKT